MKKIVIGILIVLVSVSSWSACTYNFDATQNQIDTYNITKSRKIQLMSPINISNQQGNAVIELMGSPPVDLTLASGSMLNGIPDKNVVNTGIIAFETEIDTSQLQSYLSGSSIEIQQMGWVITASSSAGAEIGLNLAQSVIINSPTDDNGNILSIIAGNMHTINGKSEIKEIDPKQISIQVPPNGKVRFGIYVNQVTKQIGYIINGINYGYFNVTANNPITKIGFLGSSQGAPYPASQFIGKSVNLKLITDRTQLQFSYPVSTTDICGGTI